MKVHHHKRHHHKSISVVENPELIQLTCIFKTYPGPCQLSAAHL
jgi:hypothetical protein